MEHETEAIESGIGTDHDSVQSEESISVFIEQMNGQLHSWCADDITTVGGYAVACSAGTGTVADSDGSCTTGSGYAIISFAVLLKRLDVICDTEATGGVPIDTHGTNAVTSGSDQTFSIDVPIKTSRNAPRAITAEGRGSYRAFQQIQNVSGVQLGVVSSITNRSNKDSDRQTNDATDESRNRGEYPTTTQYNKTGD